MTDTLSPTMVDAYHLLRLDLYRHLDEAEFLAMKHTEWCDEDVEAARTLIPDLVTVIRGALVHHKETSTGECRTCGTQSPCPSVRTIHALVKDPDREFSKLLRAADA